MFKAIDFFLVLSDRMRQKLYFTEKKFFKFIIDESTVMSRVMR